VPLALTEDWPERSGEPRTRSTPRQFSLGVCLGYLASAAH
jgi:hypothetical protein